ncbi:MAG: M56 family metallopeptidase [FCB group bacterium]|nr:M56 family metallopeptidase [FCB group bacterium]
MHQWLNSLNRHSTSWLLDLAWPMLWQSSLLIVLAAVASRTVLRKSSAQLRYGLWCVVLLRLMLPPTLDLPTSIGHWGTPVMQRHAPVFVQGEGVQPAVSNFMRQPLGGADQAPPAAPAVIDPAGPAFSITLSTAVVILWALATALLIALLLVRIARFHRVIRRAEPVPDALLQLVDRARAQMRIRRRVAALITESDLSPAVYGLFRPRILLPRTVVDELDDEQLYAVIVHELAHVKRGDYWVNWIQLALGIVYFFHPLAWYANRRMRIEREQACDDMTLITLGLNRDGYAESLVRVAERVSVAARFAPAQVGVVETKLHLARRIRRILNTGLRPVAGLTWLSAATVLAFAAIFGTWQYTQAESGAADMLSLNVKVVDEAAAPVTDASVMPDGLRAKIKGGGYGWREDVYGKPNAAKTDAQGNAQIQYPRYIEEHVETGTVMVSVSRPGYVAQRGLVEVDGSSPPIVLKQAATVRVSGYVGAKENRAWPIYALMEDPITFHGESGWVPAEGRNKELENSGVSEGDHFFWLMHRSPQGLLFSRNEKIVAQKGKTVELSVALEPGCRLEGKVDDSVPRPIRNGIADVRVIPNEVFALKSRTGIEVQWMAQAPIQEDGSFVFESLPMGHAEIAAFCDGAVVKYSDKATSSMLGQPFPVTTSGGLVSGIAMPMQATATAVIVVEDPDGRPLAGAKVAFWPNFYWFGSYSTLAAPGPFTSEESLQTNSKNVTKARIEAFLYTYSAITDETGKAVVKDLPAFAPEFAVQHDAFQLPISQESGGRRDARIELKPGETTEMTVRMERKGTSFLGEGGVAKEPVAPKSTPTLCPPTTEDKFAVPTTPATPKNQLQGQVVDEAGKPLAGVIVDAWTWCPGKETKTDSEGRFTLANLQQDQTAIEVRFSKDAYSPVYMFRQPLGKMSQPVVMNDKTYLEGRVVDSSHKPVANALVRADAGPREAEGVLITETATETHTKADGTYRLYLQHGTYTLTALAADKREMVSGGVIEIANKEARQLHVYLSPAPVFRAKVVDSVTKQPVAGVEFGNWQWKDIKGVSDANGMVAIAGIPGETFKFHLDGEDADVVRWWSEEATREFERFRVGENKWQRNFDSLAFKITPDMEPVTVVVERGARIRGTVIDPDGKPVAKATVAPALTGTGNSLTGDTRFSVESDDAGNFDMLLPASKIREYNLIAHDGDYDEWRTWANGVMEPITTQPGDVLEGVKLQLRRPCEVRGQAVDEQGKPAANREVRASTVELDDNRYYNPTTRTDNEGRFILKYVAPGKHYVQVAPFWLKPTEAPEGTSQIVEVTPEKPAEDVTLKAKPAE